MATLRTNLAAAQHDSRHLERQCLASRSLSTELAAPLTAEDQCAQAMPDASPTKWHLAHTTWFYETFVLKQYLPNYQIFNEHYHYCFNSYYEAEGPRQPRPSRGLLTRPSLDDVLNYRRHVDDALQDLFHLRRPQNEPSLFDLIELGINHEQQHQELLLTDILALFAASPLFPAYRQSKSPSPTSNQSPLLNWTEYEGGIHATGHSDASFRFDCETPRHRVVLQPYRLANDLVTNGQWLDFMADGGYTRPEFWLSDGWAAVQSRNWNAPGYWSKRDGEWQQMTLNGLEPVNACAPVCHVSYFEADAFATWSGSRLPTEQEWEHAARDLPVQGNTLSTSNLKPIPSVPNTAQQPRQMFGDVWEWTRSPYAPYPGFRTATGAVGEYNGKFMCGQFVLRGASCATPDGHSRATYRNFFYPHQRWQFMGLRLAEDI